MGTRYFDRYERIIHPMYVVVEYGTTWMYTVVNTDNEQIEYTPEDSDVVLSKKATSEHNVLKDFVIVKHKRGKE